MELACEKLAQLYVNSGFVGVRQLRLWKVVEESSNFCLSPKSGVKCG
jgi:hypothetical protein